MRLTKSIQIAILCSFLGLMTVKTAYARIDDDLQNFFTSSGFSSNVTAPNAYHGQSAGYYTGGSLFARNSVRNYQIAQVTLPSYRAGCGGIDLFSGGFSFINADGIIDAMKNILNNAKGYAFMLALESATPLLTNVMKQMHKTANDINALNINSCETAVSLLGSVWPKTQATQKKNLCRHRFIQKHVQRLCRIKASLWRWRRNV